MYAMYKRTPQSPARVHRMHLGRNVISGCADPEFSPFRALNATVSSRRNATNSREGCKFAGPTSGQGSGDDGTPRCRPLGRTRGSR
ncbi:hypothetical protein X777_03767 [Ooceraea biroi]|uniref:Uncharacterized protein n=1 Tax=Ooceraea biroi TaxID=2015173 RepID=A0A026WHP8_OOCBI|nr:hypothetical protein X777_03767 [Ooceraea biroi]